MLEDTHAAHFGLIAGERAGAAQYRLLRPARQFALHGAAIDGGRHHTNGKPDYAGRDWRLRLRLPSCVYQHKQRYEGQPLRRRDDANFERPPPSTSRGNSYCTTAHGGQIDNYKLARNNNITLRLDELNSGISTLLQTASTTASSTVFATPPKYRFSIYSMDSLWQIGLNPLMALTSNYTSGWTTASANFGVMETYSNNNDCANAACASGTTTPGGDVATNYNNSLNKLSQASYIPNPGNGTNQSGDNPQEVLFIVTDGVEDELSGGNRLEQAINDLGNAPFGNSSGTNWCTTIKNRGIKFAILYTDYLAVPTDSWYTQHIAPVLSSIGSALQACASPGLFIDEANDTHIGQDLADLFNSAAAPGHLTQ